MKHTPSDEANPIWISGILVLLALTIIGIMFYVKLIFKKTEPELTDTTAQKAVATTQPTAPSIDASSSPVSNDNDLSSVDADIKAYSTAAADIDTSINDQQGDLAE